MCKASITAVLLAFGIVAFSEESTNATIISPAGLLPTLTIPAIETAASASPPKPDICALMSTRLRVNEYAA